MAEITKLAVTSDMSSVRNGDVIGEDARESNLSFNFTGLSFERSVSLQQQMVEGETGKSTIMTILVQAGFRIFISLQHLLPKRTLDHLPSKNDRCIKKSFHFLRDPTCTE